MIALLQAPLVLHVVRCPPSTGTTFGGEIIDIVEGSEIIDVVTDTADVVDIVTCG